jgi:hypothetical protein
MTEYEVSLTLDITAEDEDDATARFWQNIEDDGRNMLVNVVEIEPEEESSEEDTIPNEDKGTPVETREIPMFRRDHDDYEMGSPEWQAVMTHNIIVNLLTEEPLNSGEMSFLKIQNDRFIAFKKKEAKK